MERPLRLQEEGAILKLMDWLPLHMSGKCIAGSDERLFNMKSAMARGLPSLEKPSEAREGTIALVGSGPSVLGQLDTIRQMQAEGVPIVAIKDAHDWLIENDVIPDYAFAVDPQAHRWNCFTRKDARVQYLIASQCHPAMFDHLAGMNVTLWHPHFEEARKQLKVMMIGGASTSGLRATVVFYVLGWRQFALFGFDSCLKDGKLRMNGDIPKGETQTIDIQLDPPHGEVFTCNPAMALQAQHFQDNFLVLPDAQFHPYGHGLIPAIIHRWNEQGRELARIREEVHEVNGRVSFIHGGGMDQASFRYRAWIPAQEMDASINDLTADTLIFAKPHGGELIEIGKAKARGAWIVADFCDDHFDWMHYQEAFRLADAITCPTEKMAERIRELGRTATVIPDPYEYPEEAPHCHGVNLLWFGHQGNRSSLQRILPELEGYPLRIVSNFIGAIPWSPHTMIREFRTADIVVIPFTDEKKSANRAMESIRQGCFVVAEPHPALNDIPGIWIGNIKEGIEWTRQHPSEASQRLSLAQSYVTEKYSPSTVTAMWKTAIQRPTTSAAVPDCGMVGSMST